MADRKREYQELMKRVEIALKEGRISGEDAEKRLMAAKKDGL